MTRFRNVSAGWSLLLLLVLGACTATPATPTPTPAAAPLAGNVDTPETMHTPTPEPRYSVFENARGNTAVCFDIAGGNFNTPRVTPATNGIDEWTLRFVVPGDNIGEFRMPVLPDQECTLFDEPIPTPAR